MMNATPDFSIDRIIRIALVGAVIWWSIVLMYPFMSILAWSFILAVALYPLYQRLNRMIGNRPIIAAALLTLVILILLVGSVVLLTNNLVEWVTWLIDKIKAGDQIIPALPESVANWPVVGSYLQDFWSSFAANMGETVKSYSSYVVNVSTVTLAVIANKTLHLFLFFVSVILSGYLLTQGKYATERIHKFAERVAFDRGAILVYIIRDTIQNVATGVIGIALLQSVCFGLLLLVAQVPGAGILSFIAFILCVAQLGLVLLAVPIIIWLFVAKSLVFASIVGALLFLVTFIDNFLKPIFLARGLSTPMLVIFIGVIGGILAYGLIGVFIGPVVLATFHNLLLHWVEGK